MKITRRSLLLPVPLLAFPSSGAEGLVVLAVNAGESRRTVQGYLDRSPAVFRAPGVPHYVVIGRDGKIEREVTGGLRSGVSRFVAGALARR